MLAKFSPGNTYKLELRFWLAKVTGSRIREWAPYNLIGIEHRGAICMRGSATVTVKGRHSIRTRNRSAAVLR